MFSQLFDPQILLIEVLAIAIGALSAQASALIDRLVDSEKYAIAGKVYQRIDPIFSKVLSGDGAIYYNDIKTVVREVATTGMSEARADAIARFVVKKFKLDKVFV